MSEYRWCDNGWGRKVLRKFSVHQPAKRSDLAAPYFKSDNIEPFRSPTDGKLYTSLSELRRSYEPENNPTGMRFTEAPEFDASSLKKPDIQRDTKADFADLYNQASAAIDRGEFK